MSKSTNSARLIHDPIASPLGNEWYAGASPRVKMLIEQRNPQTERDLFVILLETLGEIGWRLGITLDVAE